jgi:glucosylceramidase
MEVARVVVSPSTLSIRVGKTAGLTVHLKDQNDADVTGAKANFASSNTTVATVDGNGIVTGHASGSAAITVSSGHASASVSVSTYL